jgi:hypothetical protein
MTNKQNLQELIIRFQSLENNLKELKSELTLITSQLPDKEVEDDVELLVKLKYDEIKHDDIESWDKIEDLPYPILVRWEQRLWLDKNSRKYGSTVESQLKSQLGDKGYKAIEWWLYFTPDYIKSIMCNPAEISENLNRIKLHYSKGTVESKKYMKIYFDMLQEEIRAYENKLKK